VSIDRDGDDGGDRAAHAVRITPEARAGRSDAERGWLAAIEEAPDVATASFRLGRSDGVFDLRPPDAPDRPGIRAVLPPDAHGAKGGGRRNPLLRAIGPRVERVIDVTAGLGGDAFRIAMSGLPVHACERDPVVFALLASGLADAIARGTIDAATGQRLTIERVDGREAVEALDAQDVAVYVDPMYPPPKRASAKPRRELQVLRAWLGRGAASALEESAVLVERARARAARVIVKRPHHADPLVGPPDFVIESKLVRFDVYANPERMRPVGDTDAPVEGESG